MEKKADIAGKKQYKRLIIALAVLFGIIGMLILYSWWPLLTGKAVVLATRPVDPFDILQGQYIAINYDISSIPAFAGASTGKSVYVALKEDENNIWRYKDASLEPFSDSIFIRGKIKSIYGGSMSVEYNIERYFFERNAKLPSGNLTVEVKIAGSGDARISKLLYNGRPVEIEYQDAGSAF